MQLLVLLIGITCLETVTSTDSRENGDKRTNISDPNKDMYVIHATVYQVGILTNKTNDENVSNSTGKQEAVTFFKSNGSTVDFSGIPPPLLTNVTAQSLVGVAPISAVIDDHIEKTLPWTALNNLTSLTPNTKPDLIVADKTFKREVMSKRKQKGNNDSIYMDEPGSAAMPLLMILKRSLNGSDDMSGWNGASDVKTTVKITKGTAVIPGATAVNSIIIPPLLSLNNNMSDIPVPIPNTSIVKYAKINTLFKTP